MSSSRLLLLPAALLGLGLGAGCGDAPDEATHAADRSVPATTSPTSPAPRASATPPRSTAGASPSASPKAPQVAPSKDRYAARCGSTGAVRTALERLGARAGAVTDEDGSRLPVTVAGSGRTALVVLPGADGDACDAQGLVAAAASDKRFRVVAVDPCTAAVAKCVGEFALDDAAQAALVIDTVREQYDSDRVVLVGVGSGGAAAIRAAGVGVPADAVVNVSGKAAAADLRRVTVPMLHLYDDPGGASATGARAVAGERPGRVTVADAPANGWGALTRGATLTGAGREVLAFAAR